MTTRKVLSSVTIGATLAAGSYAGPAAAGTYEVLSCAAAGGINRSWTASDEDPASLRIEDSCGQVTGGAEDGLSASDRIPGPPGTPLGRQAFWRFAAPSGARISRLTAQFYLGQFSAGEWLPFIRTAEGAVLESCVPAGGQTTCERGQQSYDALGPVSVYQVDSAGLEAGVSCNATAGQCGTGATLHHVWTALYSSRVQITDPSLPTLATPSGALWADGYHHGVETVFAQASDNTGIRATRLRVDGFERGAAARICDFTLVLPCTNEPGTTIALDTRTVADGSHQLSVVAEDAALNVSSVARTIVVDNVAPAAPAGVTLEGASGPRVANRFSVRWRNPGGQVAPIAVARWTLCRPSGTGCVSADLAGAEIAELAALRVPGVGDWDLRIWLEDAAGNAESSRASPPLRLSLAGSAAGRDPRLRITKISRRGSRVTVAGSTAVAGGRVLVSVERRIGARTVRVRGTVTARHGRFSRRLRLRGRLARVHRVRVVARIDAHAGYRAATVRRQLVR